MIKKVNAIRLRKFQTPSSTRTLHGVGVLDLDVMPKKLAKWVADLRIDSKRNVRYGMAEPDIHSSDRSTKGAALFGKP